MTAYVSIGGNVGTDEEILERFRQAAALLDGASRASRVYRTAPVGPVADQPAFLNLVLALETEHEPEALLALLHDIEARLGRDRANEIRFGPRPIDLDLLLVGDRVIQNRSLELPHPRLCDRAFVLRPLSELVGLDYELPDGRRLRACLESVAVAAQQTEIVTREALPL